MRVCRSAPQAQWIVFDGKRNGGATTGNAVLLERRVVDTGGEDADGGETASSSSLEWMCRG